MAELKVTITIVFKMPREQVKLACSRFRLEERLSKLRVPTSSRMEANIQTNIIFFYIIEN
ncbi:Hypothetical protein FKW44_014592 [Caligus rogercresseyi]|uniref:Uncharacterized protein n=1 Tax=Caligus rogercresseyi TaxID=217165 RepID=A0A7T8GZD4_CALRO|nr:Hypothetical protein FKW44_014592 [Caligus rogercresseyi]